MTNENPIEQPVGGVDSHKDTIHVAVITATGRPVGDKEFPTTEAGYQRAVTWLTGHGPLQAVGVEGTSSYGVGVCTALTAAGVTVVEVNRTRPAERRKRGKTDPLDAYRAARSVLSGEATTDPKRASIEPLRALNVARRSAVKAQQAAWRQIGSLLVNAPAPLRDRLRGLTRTKLIAALVATRPSQASDPDDADILFALRSLARRHRDFAEEITNLEERLHTRTVAANPALLAVKGVGAVVAAQLLITAGDNPDRLRSSASFAALCGTAPIPVSSGRTDRYRLSRGGDRAANAALHHIATSRMSCDPVTRAYRDARLAQERCPPLPETRHRPRDTSSTGRKMPGAHLRRPPPHPPSQEHHAHPGRPPLRRLAHTHLDHRTRNPARRRPRHDLPRVAHRCLTTNRSISCRPSRGLTGSRGRRAGWAADPWCAVPRC